MGGSFPAPLSSCHSSCDQDGLKGLLLCIFGLFLCPVIVVDLNINTDLMLAFSLWYFAQNVFWFSPNKMNGAWECRRGCPACCLFPYNQQNVWEDKKWFTWKCLSSFSCQKDCLATFTIWKEVQRADEERMPLGYPGRWHWTLRSLLETFTIWKEVQRADEVRMPLGYPGRQHWALRSLLWLSRGGTSTGPTGGWSSSKVSSSLRELPGAAEASGCSMWGHVIPWWQLGSNHCAVNLGCPGGAANNFPS